MFSKLRCFQCFEDEKANDVITPPGSNAGGSPSAVACLTRLRSALCFGSIEDEGGIVAAGTGENTDWNVEVASLRQALEAERVNAQVLLAQLEVFKSRGAVAQGSRDKAGRLALQYKAGKLTLNYGRPPSLKNSKLLLGYGAGKLSLTYGCKQVLSTATFSSPLGSFAPAGKLALQYKAGKLTLSYGQPSSLRNSKLSLQYSAGKLTLAYCRKEAQASGIKETVEAAAAARSAERSLAVANVPVKAVVAEEQLEAEQRPKENSWLSGFKRSMSEKALASAERPIVGLQARRKIAEAERQANKASTPNQSKATLRRQLCKQYQGGKLTLADGHQAARTSTLNQSKGKLALQYNAGKLTLAYGRQAAAQTSMLNQSKGKLALQYNAGKLTLAYGCQAAQASMSNQACTSTNGKLALHYKGGKLALAYGHQAPQATTSNQDDSSTTGKLALSYKAGKLTLAYGHRATQASVFNQSCSSTKGKLSLNYNAGKLNLAYGHQPAQATKGKLALQYKGGKLTLAYGHQDNSDAGQGGPQSKRSFIVTASEEYEKLGFSVTAYPPQEVFIKTLTEDLWADRAGLEVDDKILCVNGTDVAKMDRQTFVLALKTRPLQLTCLRFTEEKEKTDDSPDVGWAPPSAKGVLQHLFPQKVPATATDSPQSPTDEPKSACPTQ